MVVSNEIQYQKMIEFIDNYNYFAFDVETTGLNTRKDQVIGFGISNTNDESFYLPIKIWNGSSLSDTGFDANPILEKLSKKNIITWNGSFDIRITKNNLGINLLDSLFAEGMLMKHCLIEDGRFGLKQTGIEFSKEIGYDVEGLANKEQIELKKNLEKNGASPKEFYKADLDILGVYCEKDCILTFKLFKYFHDRLEAEGLLDFFYKDEVMPLYKLCTIPMEDNGVRVDVPKLENYSNNIQIDINNLKNKVIKSLLKIDSIDSFILDNIKSKCKISNKGAFAQFICDKYNINLPIGKNGKYSLIKSKIEKLKDSDVKSFLLGESDTLSNQDDLIIEMYKQHNENIININSKKQMADLVFNFMKIKPISKTKKGSPQFNEAFVESIKDSQDWAFDLYCYNKLMKIKTSYFDRISQNMEDGHYYFNYKQHGTISGRYGSDAQQFPRPKEEGELPDLVLKYNNIIRELFISKEGMCFIDDDYASLEPHVFADVSNDEGLRSIFRNGHDFYSTIAIATEKLDGFSADKNAPNYLGKLDKPKRQMCKGYALGCPYGMKAYALGKTLDITTEKAQKLLDGYLNAYPNLKKWMEESEYKAKTEGFVKTKLGRVRHLPRVKELFELYGNRLDDWKFCKSLESRMDKTEFMNMKLDWKNGLNNAKNFQIQGLSASIVNRAMIDMTRRFKELKLNAYPVAQIHDQIIVECDDKDKDIVKNIVQNSMENTTKISLKLTAEPCVGYNWREAH